MQLCFEKTTTYFSIKKTHLNMEIQNKVNDMEGVVRGRHTLVSVQTSYRHLKGLKLVCLGSAAEGISCDKL